MTVSLPDSMRDWIEARAKAYGFADIDRFVEQVLRNEQERIHRDVDAKLIEGIDSGEPIAVNAAFWAERRRVLEERLTKESA